MQPRRAMLLIRRDELYTGAAALDILNFLGAIPGVNDNSATIVSMDACVDYTLRHFGNGWQALKPSHLILQAKYKKPNGRPEKM